MDETLWVCGTLGKVHGLRGELYVNLAPRGFEYLCAGVRFYLCDEAGGLRRPCALTRVGGSDARPLIALDLAASREAAVALQGLTLLAAGEALDDLPHYRAGDLIGRVLREQGSGAMVGTVVDVLAAPAQDVLQVRPAGGRDLLVPLADELVWTADDGSLTVRAGLLDLEAVGEDTAAGEGE